MIRLHANSYVWCETIENDQYFLYSVTKSFYITLYYYSVYVLIQNLNTETELYFFLYSRPCSILLEVVWFLSIFFPGANENIHDVIVLRPTVKQYRWKSPRHGNEEDHWLPLKQTTEKSKFVPSDQKRCKQTIYYSN